MSREAYQIPPTVAGGAGASGSGSAPSLMRATGMEEGATISYICGDCGTKFPLKRNEAIRCRECGCRVLYKERTKRMVQFEAR